MVYSFDVIDISDVEQDNYEQMGTKSKFWYADENGESWLFKSIQTMNGAGEIVERKGEDWAEKVSYEIAGLMKIPVSRVELARYKGVSGIITKNFIPKGHRLIFANEFLQKNTRGNSGKVAVRSHFHTISRIQAALDVIVINKPAGWDSLPAVRSAADFFCGYLLFDCLIANQDRHEENWGLIVTPDRTNHLAVSFDHAASLGRNETDEVRRERLTSLDAGRRMPVYARRAKSQIFDSRNKRLKTFEAMVEFSKRHRRALRTWIELLDGVSKESIEKIFDGLPGGVITNTSKEFSIELIMENKARIVEYGHRNLS